MNALRRSAARVRLTMRRARWLVFGGGVTWSALALAVAFDPVLVYGERVTNHGTVAIKAWEWFLVTNPPAIVLLATQSSKNLPFEPNLYDVSLAFGLSCAWWLVIAVMVRRRRAKVLA